MDMQAFSHSNAIRCGSGFGHNINDWTTSDWIVATLGELGEAANIVKKLNRVRDDIKGNRLDDSQEKLMGQLADEIADTFIYLDLLATSLGMSLEQIVKEKWNVTSDRIGYKTYVK